MNYPMMLLTREADYLSIANSIPMWIASALAIVLVITQAILFLRKSFQTGREMGLREEQMKSAMKSSLITSIGPSIVVATGLVSLLAVVGGPMAWMRLGFIGSVMFEVMAAGMGTQAVGVTIGTDPMTKMAFAAAVWTMILGALGWIVFATISAKQMGKFQKSFEKKDPKIVGVISISAVLGAFATFCINNLITFDKVRKISHFTLKNKATIACLIGGLLMFILVQLADKMKLKWLNEWALTMALFGGMIITAILPSA